jgi:hypothetical protein
MANQVFVKDFHVEQELKNNGKHLGDIQISKTGVTWCEGRSSKNVTKFSFDELNWIAFYKKEVLSAVKAARKKDGL